MLPGQFDHLLSGNFDELIPVLLSLNGFHPVAWPLFEEEKVGRSGEQNAKFGLQFLQFGFITLFLFILLSNVLNILALFI